jgi:hypothetical protein
MILWSIVSRETWIELQKKGRLRATRRYITKDFLHSYLWMAGQMKHRLKPPPWGKNAFPLWAWYQWEGKKRRMPDLRSGGHLENGHRGVRLEFIVPEDRILLSDFELWHFILNYGYLPESDEDDVRFENIMKKNHLSVARFSHRNPLPQKYHRILEKSWERIFDLSWIANNPGMCSADEKQSIQATLWEINLIDVIRATEFIAR